MKKQSSILIYLSISLYSLLFSFQEGHCQNDLLGTWEGIFMNDFEILFDFRINNQNQLVGDIKMIAGEKVIQDDKLVNIKQTNKELTFYITDKQTSFEGSFNDRMTELSGQFVFPDGSKHAVQVKRKMDEALHGEDFTMVKEKVFDADELHSDLIFLYSSLKELHPQLYAFTSKDSMAEIVENLKDEIKTNLTLEEFYFLTTQLTDVVNCSHTGVRLPLAYQNLASKFAGCFPFRLLFTNGKAFYISGDGKGGNKILPGNEIISINNRSIDEIIKKIFYLIPSEGCNITTKYNELNKKFNKLFYFLDDSEKYIVKFNKEASIDSITVASSRLEDVDQNNGSIENKSPVDFKYIENKTVGLLKIPSFSMPNMDIYFQQLDSIFRALKATNTKSLIIDLRDNSGGHPIFAAQLFSYLTDKDFVYFKRNKEVKDFEPLYNAMQPNKLNFNGNLYIIINGGCLSTTGHLISLLSFNTNAIFIGEEPGSTFRCNDFSIQLTLPNTGIELNVPRTTFETAVTGFTLCEPFVINHKVNETIVEVINKKDAYIEMAKILASEK